MWKASRAWQRSEVAGRLKLEYVQGQIMSHEQFSKYVPLSARPSWLFELEGERHDLAVVLSVSG